jgi:hypothetical protein
MASNYAVSVERSFALFGFTLITSLLPMSVIAQVPADPAAQLAPATAATTLQPVISPTAPLMPPAPLPAPTAASKKPNVAKPVPAAAHPLWQELSAPQKAALAPLANEWDALEVSRKKKWLEIGTRFSSMKPDEQQRVQERMREWAKLTPEQRRVARESFARAKKLDPEQKSAQWQQYQQLPEEQKKKLAADASAKTPVARLPSTHNNKSTILPPIKATPKPVLEQSVTPQATSQSDIGPTPLLENK